jgi:hypothetical protein
MKDIIVSKGTPEQDGMIKVTLTQMYQQYGIPDCILNFPETMASQGKVPR